MKHFFKFDMEFVFQMFLFSGACLVRSLSFQEFVFQEFVFQESVFQEFVMAPAIRHSLCKDDYLILMFSNV